MNNYANMKLMIVQIEERIWDQWAPIPVSPDSEEVGAGPPCDFGEVNQPVAPPDSENYSLGRSLSGNYEPDP